MSDICAEIKRLIRFDVKNAISKSQEHVNELAKKYTGISTHASMIKIDQLRADAELLKWCTKAMLYDIDGIFALNEINPVLKELHYCAKVCSCEATKEKSEALLRAEVQAVLQYSSGVLLQLA